MAKKAPYKSSLALLRRDIASKLNLDSSSPIDASAWFLGPKGENSEALLKFVKMAVDSQVNTRSEYMPQDPAIFPAYDDRDHLDSIAIIEQKLGDLLGQLQGSIPLASYRNQSHMYWDQTLPGVVGYFAAMLYNQNNVAAEASPVTTHLEVEVGKDLCGMLGFGQPTSGDSAAMQPWGHITCDGSVANGESMWAARNLKYLPVALAAAIATEADLAAAKCFSVMTCRGERYRLVDASIWDLLNLPIDEVIGLVARIEKETGIDAARVRRAVDDYSVQNVGLVQFHRRFLEDDKQACAVVLAPATAHYSWPKSAALLGLGTKAVIPIEVDLNGRMCMTALRKALCKCLRNGRPVLQLVAVIGTTEEGAIDPLAEILEIRREFQQLGLNFVVHADAAWGGYFASIQRSGGVGQDPAGNIDDYPQLYFNRHFESQYAALPAVDSVTLDPHKSGFIPYPAGSLCYRNGAMRDLIAFTAPVVFHGGVDVTVGPYGIEGSKPGAAAASIYLSNKVIPLNLSGYGRILGRCLFNAKRFYAALVTMDLDSASAKKNAGAQIHITPFQRLPAQQQGQSPADILKQKKFIAKNFVNCTNQALIKDVLGLPDPKEKQREALELFQAMGSDLSIVTYAFNFSTPKQGMNSSLRLMNELNDRVFRALSLQTNEGGKIPTVEMFVTASAFDAAQYGDVLVEDFAGRAGVKTEPHTPISFLISTTQNPWLTANSQDINMITPLIEILRNTVERVAAEIIEENNLE